MMTTSNEMPGLNRRERNARNWFAVLFVFLSVSAAVVLVCGLLSLIYPNAGIPFIWVAFPVGPIPAPIPS